MAESFYELTGGQRQTGFVKAQISMKGNDEDIVSSMQVKKPYTKKTKEKAIRFVQSLGIVKGNASTGQSNTMDAYLKGGYVSGHTNVSIRMLEKYGDRQIFGLRVVRTPLSSSLNRLLNVLSLGKMKRMKQEHAFSDYFHLYLVADMGNRNPLVIEKNERVGISQSYKKDKRSQEMSIELRPNQSLTPNMLLETTLSKIGNYNFFQYRAFSLNCQRFIKDILQSNGLLTKQLDEFIMQPVESIAKKMSPGFKKVANVATDVAGYVSKLFGRGCECKDRRKRAMQMATVLRGKGLSKSQALSMAWKHV